MHAMHEEPEYSPGENVQITSGSFAGTTGKLVAFDPIGGVYFVEADAGVLQGAILAVLGSMIEPVETEPEPEIAADDARLAEGTRVVVSARGEFLAHAGTVLGVNAEASQANETWVIDVELDDGTTIAIYASSVVESPWQDGGPEGHDPVNHPQHYTDHPSGIECIQITEHMNFTLGNAVKYIWRADLKTDAIEDLKKARWYVDREIERRERNA